MRIIYINGEDIENWLSMHPNIEAKYFKKRTAQKYIIEDRIEEVCFLDKYDNDSNQFLKLSTLELDKEYFLYIRYQSSIKQQIELLANNAIVFLQEYTNVNFNPAYIYVEKGTNTFFVPIKITSAQNEYALCIKGNTGN